MQLMAGITEPDTIFYGKIVNRTGPQEYFVTQGKLVWVISRPDGQQITLRASLAPIDGGTYSYQLAVPHEALAFGLVVSSNAVPLPVQKASCGILQITVDGAPATILAPGTALFNVAQSFRGSTYRLDLELTNPLTDTDGSGLPDWWKAKYGLLDPNADPDHDGWNNLQEFLNGSDPMQDNRNPSLATKELFVYADGSTGIRLESVDSDSTAANLFYTLTEIPNGGTLFLRNNSPSGTNSDLALNVGGTFTQEQINKGALIFVHQATNSDNLTTSLSVSLHDENDAHPGTNGTVTLNLYRPNYSDDIVQLAKGEAASPVGFTNVSGLTFYEQQMLLNYYLSRDQGYLIWDLSRSSGTQDVSVSSSGLTPAQYAIYTATYGKDRRHVLVGGPAGGHLSGGMENDILIGSRGTALRGNGGADLFVLPNVNIGNVTIDDFSTNDTDALDLSRVLLGASTELTNYLQVTSSGTNSYIGINTNGTGGTYTNLTVTLLGTHFVQADLRTLVDNGNVITGSKAMSPQISIVASVPNASQNGPIAGELTLTRSGSLGSPTAVNLLISGSAQNGVDYQIVSQPVTFNQGERQLKIQINPYPNSVTVAKVAQFTVISGTGYEVGSPSTAQVSIEPLMPQIAVEAVQPTAVKSDLTPGEFLVTRGGATDRSVLVRVTISGTAANGVDYALISSNIAFTAGQTFAFVDITPKSTAVLNNGMEYVQLTVKTDATYKVMSPSVARVFIVDQLYDLSSWQQKYFSGSAEDKFAFANDDSGHTGIKNIFRYAFGLNATAPQNSKGLPVVQIIDGHLAVSFKEPTSVTDIQNIVQVSDDLKTWRSDDSIEQFFPTNTTDVETVYYRNKETVQDAPETFMRVQVVAEP
jgi:hypothetical protein